MTTERLRALANGQAGGDHPEVDAEDAAEELFRRGHKRGAMSWNPAPPPPQDPTIAEQFGWLHRTFAPGTTVKFWGGGHSWHVGNTDRGPEVLVPDGTRGTVAGVLKWDRSILVVVRVHDARRYAYAAEGAPGEAQGWLTADIEDMWEKLDAQGTDMVARTMHVLTAENALIPLDDNWGPAQRPYKSKPYRGRHTEPNPRSASRGLSSNRDMRELFDAAIAAGWSAERTHGNHVRLLSPDKSIPPIITSSTPSDPRAVKNLRAMLRRHGLDV